MPPVTRKTAPPTVSARAPIARRPVAATTTTLKASYTGAEGLNRARIEEDRQASRREMAVMNADMPMRFWSVAGEPGREIVIVDSEPFFYRSEHNIQNTRTGMWDIYCACVGEDQNCPGCKVLERPSYFALYLTVIDLTPYVNKHGEEVPWSKKLLVVKMTQQKKFTRLFEREGSLRGAIMLMTRDGKKDAQIGNDIEFQGFMDEEELLSYETQYVYMRDNKEVSKDIIGHEPFDYQALFPDPTMQQLQAIVGGRPEAGSRDSEDRAIGRRGAPAPRGRGDDWEDAPAPRTSRAPVRAAEPTEDIGDDSPDVGEEAPPPRRAATREVPVRGAPAREAPARNKAPIRRAAPEDEEVEEAEEAEEVEEAPPPPRRSAPRATATPQRAAPARRPPQPDPEEEEAPQRTSASSMAQRRMALRR